MKIEYRQDIQEIINKPFYTSKDIATFFDVSNQTAREVMRSESFPLIECGEPGGLKPRLRVEAVAFWRWARSKRNRTGLYLNDPRFYGK